ncbi:MAG: hypothetical protein BAA04_12445 [Firmicutes bacterium ZCTH02-B6]|nr:MAG: hypothetical protein BAA04_12445 [Firmicutes bacterium ZCTH02-B6]
MHSPASAPLRGLMTVSLGPVWVVASPRLPKGQLLISTGLACALQLQHGTSGAVRLGAGTASGVLRVFPGRGFVLCLWPAAVNALHVPVPVRLWARKGTAGAQTVIELGPVVGILAGQYHGTYRLFLEMARRRATLAYLFTPADVLWDGRVVLGRLRKRGRWVRRPCPFPHVVFDRSIGIGRHDEVKELLSRMSADGCAVFNGDLGDKWSMHQHLASWPELSSHLPETALLESWDTVRAMLSRWCAVYVKPAAGFMGLGILRIERAGQGFVRLASSTGLAGRRVSEAVAAGIVGERLANGKWLVQQALDLVRVSGSPCDVRVLALKDGCGRWRIASVIARRAGAGKIVSNLHRGDPLCPGGSWHGGFRAPGARRRSRSTSGGWWRRSCPL